MRASRPYSAGWSRTSPVIWVSSPSRITFIPENQAERAGSSRPRSEIAVNSRAVRRGADLIARGGIAYQAPIPQDGDPVARARATSGRRVAQGQGSVQRMRPIRQPGLDGQGSFRIQGGQLVQQDQAGIRPQQPGSQDGPVLRRTRQNLDGRNSQPAWLPERPQQAFRPLIPGRAGSWPNRFSSRVSRKSRGVSPCSTARTAPPSAGWPKIRTCPVWASSRPESRRSRVVFPEPLLPDPDHLPRRDHQADPVEDGGEARQGFVGLGEFDGLDGCRGRRVHGCFSRNSFLFWMHVWVISMG